LITAACAASRLSLAVFRAVAAAVLALHSSGESHSYEYAYSQATGNYTTSAISAWSFAPSS